MTDLSAFSMTTSVTQPSATFASGRVRGRDRLSRRLMDYFNALERNQGDGYASINVLSYDWGSRTGLDEDGVFSQHKVLIRIMPAYHVKTGRAINMLAVGHKEAIVAKYGLYQDNEGRLMTNADKAAILGLTVRAFDGRVKTARRKLRRIFENVNL